MITPFLQIFIKKKQHPNLKCMTDFSCSLSTRIFSKMTVKGIRNCSSAAGTQLSALFMCSVCFFQHSSLVPDPQIQTRHPHLRHPAPGTQLAQVRSPVTQAPKNCHQHWKQDINLFRNIISINTSGSRL